jgi:hypothetical protein
MSGPVGQGGYWVFIDFFYCLRAKMSLRCKLTFPGRRGVSLANYHLLRPPEVGPSIPPYSNSC